MKKKIVVMIVMMVKKRGVVMVVGSLERVCGKKGARGIMLGNKRRKPVAWS